MLLIISCLREFQGFRKVLCFNKINKILAKKRYTRFGSTTKPAEPLYSFWGMTLNSGGSSFAATAPISLRGGGVPWNT